MLLTLLAACGGSPADTAAEVIDRTVTLAPPARGSQIVTPAFEVPAFSEVEICTVIRMDPSGDEALLWVNQMESLVSEGTHHMNVLIGQFSFLDAVLGDGAGADALGVAEGQYPCDELDTMEQAFPVFPSQRTNQRITLPEGVAVPMTAPLVLIFSHHYVNSEAAPVRINAALNAETIPSEQVTDVAGLIFDDIGDLSIAPGTRQVVSRTCVVERDLSVILTSTHTHEWGECTTLHRYDGASGVVEAEPFFVNKSWDQPPILHFEPGTFELSPGDGVHWACHYGNDTDRVLVNDGTAEGEMCVFAAATWPTEWTVADVEEALASGDLGGMVALMEDAMGPCDTVRDDIEGPWPDQPTALDDGPPACEDLTQTESNELE